MTEAMNRFEITLLDGGMGRELERMGAPFRQPEWSALSLMEGPEFVRKAHESYAKAGSEILTTSNYAVVPFHLGEERFLSEGAKLTALAGQLAREATSKFDCRVAGSIPPLFGSYRPDLFVPDRTQALYEIIFGALAPHIDFWLAETLSSIDEAEAVASVFPVISDHYGSLLPSWMARKLMGKRRAFAVVKK
jgi:S-methylmethionine-dependent homocysteine/selenocysteine methylase